jgi:large-conductance mechanosensitive channel
MIKIAAKYGLMCGLISVLSSTIFYTLGLAFKSQWWISSLANILILALIIFLVVMAVKEFRKETRRHDQLH